MDSGVSAPPRKEGTWTKLIIFIALYFLLFESILEAVLALYLYGNGQVDSKMTLSVVLSLVAVCSTWYMCIAHFTNAHQVVFIVSVGRSTEPRRLGI
jgi:cation transport ATPase